MWGVSLLSVRNGVRVIAGLAVAVAFLGIYFSKEGDPRLWFWLLLGGMVALAASFGFDHFVGAAERRHARRFAALNGWEYVAALPGLFARLETPPFDAPRRTYTSVVRGTYGGFECYDGVLLCEVRFDDDLTVTMRYRVAAVRLPDDLPRLMLQPEGVHTALTKALGGADRNFESARFNRTWRVLADNPKVAHDMISPRVMERLERLEFPAPLLFEKGFGVRIDPDSVGVDTLAERLAGLIAVAEFIPRHTLEDHGARTGQGAVKGAPLPSSVIPGALTNGFQPEIAAADEAAIRSRLTAPDE